MEFNISDLLDELQEVPMDILPYTAASEERIKALTRRKIREKGTAKVHRTGLGTITKVLIAAILVATLTVTAMAATGTRFEDWVVGLEEPKTAENSGYDKDLLMGGSAYYWEVSNWMVRIETMDQSETGITMECIEYGSGEKTGSLTMDGTYWLEVWNGTGYEVMAATIPAGESVTIERQSTHQWSVDWSSMHGALDSGNYRLGIPFTHTAEDGTEEKLKFYAKFRIFSAEMDGYIEKCNDALEARYRQEILHAKETRYQYRADIREELGYAYYTEEIWKYGNDYLTVLRYYDENGTYIEHYGGGHLCRNGVGYTLDWTDEALSEVAEWERAKFVEDNDVSYGFYLRGDVMRAIVGEIWDDENTIYAISYHDFVDESLLSEEDIKRMNEENPLWNYNYDEQVYTFDDSGNLIGYEKISQTARSAEESERATTYKLEIFDTDPEEIRKMIDRQNVSGLQTFTWSEDQARYGETAVTEGFRNTTPQKVTSADDAVNIARNEADITAHPYYREGDEYNLAAVCYDDGADVWKVQFSYSQDDDKVLLVYLSGDGITLMTVYP